MAEKRGYTRLLGKGDLTLWVAANPSQTMRGTLVDVSFSGFCLSSSQRMEEGIEVLFELRISPLKLPLKGRGKIIYVKEVVKNNIRGYRNGVRFLDVDGNLVKRMLNAVQTEIILQKRQVKKIV